jgi:2-haloacid dehalogenase
MRLCLFDAYGTLFDVHSAMRRHSVLLGPKVDAVSQLWRSRQLEYAWVHALAGRYRDFWELTKDSLDYALAAHGVRDEPLTASLLDAYLKLDLYPEAPEVLEALHAGGIACGVLSNGSPMMLERLIKSAVLDHLLDRVLSVDEVRTYKPDPRVYALACERFGVDPGQVVFLSSNAWDAAGAAAFGMRACWINRTGQPGEYAAMARVVELASMTALPQMVIEGTGWPEEGR